METWNGIRALDYPQSRPEVDPDRLGVTGRSGGGATSWFIAAADERIKAAVAVAGITDLRNHVIDRVVDGHCDCMFPQNTKRWDFAKIAALIAPRPLLIGNTDKDTIFPLDGVQRIHKSLAQLYFGIGAANKLGLLLCEGSHQDFQELQIGAFRWFKRFLANEPDFKAPPSQKMFAPRELRVFTSLPKDERTSTSHEWFVPKAAPEDLPTDAEGWRQKAPALLAKIRAQSFGNCAASISNALFKHLGEEVFGTTLVSHYAVGSDAKEPLNGWNGLVIAGEERAVRTVSSQLEDKQLSGATSGVVSSAPAMHIQIVDDKGMREQLEVLRHAPRNSTEGVTLFFAPRGFSSCEGSLVNPLPWSTDPKVLTRIRRRFMLIGQTLDSARVYDIAQLVKSIQLRVPSQEFRMKAEGTQAVNTLYATLFSENIKHL